MGKRKLHGVTYFQCDWTGLPMRTSNCYMPTWNEAGKLVKHGSYCNWESVVAHVIHDNAWKGVHGTSEQEAEERIRKVREYVNNLVGTVVEPAPHYTKLAWFCRDSPTIHSPQDFHEACVNSATPVVAVRLLADGSAHEVICVSDQVKARFAAFLTRPFNLHGPLHEPQSFQTMRKKHRERDLTVFYWPFKNGLPFNQTASNIFKMQIYGDCLLVEQTKEPCFLPRERYVNFHLTHYIEQFTSKKRPHHYPDAVDTAEYAELKAEMQESLLAMESVSSSSAALPTDLAKASVLPPADGRELAGLLKQTGVVPPPPAKKAKV